MGGTFTSQEAISRFSVTKLSLIRSWLSKKNLRTSREKREKGALNETLIAGGNHPFLEGKIIRRTLKYYKRNLFIDLKLYAPGNA